MTTTQARTDEVTGGGAFSRAAAELFPGYFALVMATGIVSIAAYLLELKAAAWALLFVNVAAYAILWLLLGVRLVRFFTFITVREEKPALEAGLNGTWLLAAVATQSVSVLGTLLAGRFGAQRETLLFLTLCLFLLECMLYLLLITLIFYRFSFVNFTPILRRSTSRRC